MASARRATGLREVVEEGEVMDSVLMEGSEINDGKASAIIKRYSSQHLPKPSCSDTTNLVLSD